MSKSPFGQDTQFVRQQYRTADNLAVRRRTHEIYGTEKTDLITWNLDQIQWQGSERVLDVGCGDGAYTAAAQKRARRYIAGDFSLGMLAGLSGRASARVNLDAQELPFSSDSMDVILANHMLYHVPDQQRAVTAFRRVLRPGGKLLAATNSAHNMPELKDLQMAVMDKLGLDTDRIFWEHTSLTFTLENGAALFEPHFTHVERRDLPGTLVFPTAQPLIDYLGSMQERYLALLPAGVTWERVAQCMAEIISTHIEEHGSFLVSKLAGTFVCC